MAGKSFYYLIDNLTSEKAVKISKALQAVAEVLEAKASPSQGVLEVRATRDVEAQVKIACEIAGTTFRTRMSRRLF
jgi:acyl dehydratase